MWQKSVVVAERWINWSCGRVIRCIVIATSFYDCLPRRRGQQRRSNDGITVCLDPTRTGSTDERRLRAANYCKVIIRGVRSVGVELLKLVHGAFPFQPRVLVYARCPEANRVGVGERTALQLATLPRLISHPQPQPSHFIPWLTCSSSSSCSCHHRRRQLLPPRVATFNCSAKSTTRRHPDRPCRNCLAAPHIQR